MQRLPLRRHRPSFDTGRTGTFLRATVVLLALVGAVPGRADAQRTGSISIAGRAFAGGEVERYLRVLQSTGRVPLYPWSLRAFTPGELDRLAPTDTAHPWAARYRFGADSVRMLRAEILDPRVRWIYNSAFPHGSNDGPVWAGRGLTTALEGGFSLRLPHVTATVAPLVFWAQNQSFPLAEHKDPVHAPHLDWRRPTQIDLPQRFGEAPYLRLDPGQSTLQLDARGVAVGVTTANEVWGPAAEYPLILGTNAAGYPRAYLGTARPASVGIGRVHGRFHWGRLDASAFPNTPADSSRRFMTGFVGVFTPNGIPGLEIGASRFFHLPWPKGGIGLAQVVKPFETLLKTRLIDRNETEIPESVAANQLVSVFARWVLSRSGVELYGELASDDHRHNLRDVALEPDHSTTYALGLQKAWQQDSAHVTVLRAELLNARPSHLHRAREQAPFYVHSVSRQGHTQRGQILGSPSVYGGAGSTVAVDRYRPDGRWSVAWRRTLRQERGEYLVTGVAERPDVLQSLELEVLRFRGPVEIAAGLAGVYNFDRNFERDSFNLGASLEVRVTP